MRLSNFWGGGTDMLAKKEALLSTRERIELRTDSKPVCVYTTLQIKRANTACNVRVLLSQCAKRIHYASKLQQTVRFLKVGSRNVGVANLSCPQKMAKDHLSTAFVEGS